MKIFPNEPTATGKEAFDNMAPRVRRSIMYFAFVAGTLLFTGCSKYDSNRPEVTPELESRNLASPDHEVINDYRGLSQTTLWELQQARAATAKYQHIDKAFADGYADINVVVPNMGYHFMKSALVDSVFDVRHPEILVYNKNLDGSFSLVAVEYAVPISVTPDKAPEGFTGSEDVWERNTTFGLWLQHAWVWAFNPDGVFHDTNPLIQVH